MPEGVGARAAALLRGYVEVRPVVVKELISAATAHGDERRRR